MIDKKKHAFRSSTSPTLPTGANNQPTVDPFDDQPRRPDWLVLLMSALFLLTLLLVWLMY